MSASSAKSQAADAAVLVSASIADIIVGTRLRKVLPDRVATLQEGFKREGQMTPIDLVEVDGGMRLIFGAHRLAARVANGDADVRAILHPRGTFGSDADIQRREIAENFERFELTVLERAANIEAMRDIYLAEHGQVKRGRKAKQAAADALDEISANLALNFPEVVQRTLGLSRRDVFRALKVASIAAVLRDQLAAHSIAKNQSELLALAEEKPERQARIVALLTSDPAEATSVGDAIAVMDGVEPADPLKPHERFSDTFSRLKRAEQHRFFELHADDIEQWLAARSTPKGRSK